MSLADSLQGSAYFLPTLAASVVVGLLVTGKRFAHLGRLQHALAVCVLASTALIFANVIPAALTILSRPAALITALLLMALAWRAPACQYVPERAPLQPARSGPISIAISVIAVAVMLVYELARVRINIGQMPDFIDAMSFHLPGVSSWIHTGTLWQVDQFLPGFATAQYPNNGDFLLLASVLPWHDLALVRWAMLPFYALTGVGAFALAVELGASRAAAATFAAAAMTVPYISHYALEAIPDVVTLSMMAVGLVFALRYLRSRIAADLVLGGLALGLSFGTKWYGVTGVAVIVVVWVAAWLLMRRPWRDTARDTGIILGTIAIGGGVWLLRNVIESDNPIYPKAVKLLGVTLFPGSRNDVLNKYGYTIASYLGKPHILREFIYPGFKLAFGFTGLVILVAVAIAAVSSARALYVTRPPRGVRRGAADVRGCAETRLEATRVMILIVVAIGIFLTYIITPGTAYGPKNLPLGGYPTLRWLMPDAVLGMALGAVAARMLGRGSLILEVAGLLGMLDGIRRGDDIPVHLVARVVLVLVVVLAIAALGWQRRQAIGGLLSRRAPLVASMIAAIVVCCGLLWVLQHHFNRDAYASADPVFAWIDKYAPSGHRVGITGEANLNGLAPVLPMAGPRLGNEIAYVGDTSVHSVELPASARSFDAELRRGHYDLLEIGVQDTGHTDQWVRALRWRLVASSPRLALYASPSMIATVTGRSALASRTAAVDAS